MQMCGRLFKPWWIRYERGRTFVMNTLPDFEDFRLINWRNVFGFPSLGREFEGKVLKMRMTSRSESVKEAEWLSLRLTIHFASRITMIALYPSPPLTLLPLTYALSLEFISKCKLVRGLNCYSSNVKTQKAEIWAFSLRIYSLPSSLSSKIFT